MKSEKRTRLAVRKAPGAAAELVWIESENSLDQLQKAVGGYIERANTFFDDFLTVWINEEGLLLHLSPNVDIGGIIVGPVVVEGIADDEGETTGLTTHQAAVVVEMLNKFSVENGAKDV